MTQFQIPSFTITKDPETSAGFALSGQTTVEVSFDNTPMTAGESFDWKVQYLYPDALWHDGGGQHVESGTLTLKHGGTTHIYDFVTSIPVEQSPTQVRITGYNVQGLPVSLSNVTLNIV